jgi:hypothetical protein
MAYITKVISDFRITLDPEERKKQNISIGDHVFIDFKKVTHEKDR